jgi:hypothetical protein
MANFESPIGNRKIPSTGGMRNFDVPDETGYHNPQPMQPQYAAQYPQMPQIDENSIREFQSRMQQQQSQQDLAQRLQENIEIERQLQEAKLAKKQGKDRLNEGAKRRLEILLGMTQVVREVNIEENIFMLKTLTSKQIRESLEEISKVDGTIQAPYEIRRQFLARSLTHIAGVEFDQFIGSNLVEQKLLFIDELDDALLSRLYAEYIEMSNESKQKYAIKNNEDVKEVLEDLKK